MASSTPPRAPAPTRTSAPLRRRDGGFGAPSAGAPPPPLLYVGIVLERVAARPPGRPHPPPYPFPYSSPSAAPNIREGSHGRREEARRPSEPFSWGLSLTLPENDAGAFASYAVVVGVRREDDGRTWGDRESGGGAGDGRRIKWCRVTDRAPAPSVAFRSSAGEAGEWDLIRGFPPPVAVLAMDAAAMVVPRLEPGDAVLSVDGTPVSSFGGSLAAMAAHVRRKPRSESLRIVAMRCEGVWRAAGDMIAANEEEGRRRRRWMTTVEARSRVSATALEAWRKALAVRQLRHWQQHQQQSAGFGVGTAAHPMAWNGGKVCGGSRGSGVGFNFGPRGFGAGGVGAITGKKVLLHRSPVPSAGVVGGPVVDSSITGGGLSRTVSTSPSSYAPSKGLKRNRGELAGTRGKNRVAFDAVEFDRRYAVADIRRLRNGTYRDGNGNALLYYDNDDFDPDDGRRIGMFVNREMDRSFRGWLLQRKCAWRRDRSVRCRRKTGTASSAVQGGSVPGGVVDANNCGGNDYSSEAAPPREFWLDRGYESFRRWLAASKAEWRRSYSWQEDRRRRLRVESEREVHFPRADGSSVDDDGGLLQSQFEDWLRTRKQHWRISRRKRQRRQRRSLEGGEEGEGRSSNKGAAGSPVTDPRRGGGTGGSFGGAASEALVSVIPRGGATNPAALRVIPSTEDAIETMCIDEMLEDQERLVMEAENRPALDVAWIFFADLGAPDDIVAVLMRFLRPAEHGNLLCLNFCYNAAFRCRQDMWRTLCPQRWTLPRRPRKSFSHLYISKIREEEETSRKRSDDVLLKAHVAMEKADQLSKIERLVRKAEEDFDFSVDYTSGIVLERNSILNIAVIAGRHKIAKWLIEEKGANVETCDRGAFTPLLNSAWGGDRRMVRYLLGRGADRTKVGTGHSSEGLAAANFVGLHAEGWAQKRGHHEVAELIRLGI